MVFLARILYEMRINPHYLSTDVVIRILFYVVIYVSLVSGFTILFWISNTSDLLSSDIQRTFRVISPISYFERVFFIYLLLGSNIPSVSRLTHILQSKIPHIDIVGSGVVDERGLEDFEPFDHEYG